jgi:hypothetical protein
LWNELVASAATSGTQNDREPEQSTTKKPTPPARSGLQGGDFELA